MPFKYWKPRSVGWYRSGPMEKSRSVSHYIYTWLETPKLDTNKLKSAKHYQYNGKLRHQKWPCFWEAKNTGAWKHKRLGTIELTYNSQVASQSTPEAGMSLRPSCKSIRSHWALRGEWYATRKWISALLREKMNAQCISCGEFHESPWQSQLCTELGHRRRMRYRSCVSTLLEQIVPLHNDGRTHPSNFNCPFRIPFFLSSSFRDPKASHSGCASFRKLNLTVLSKTSTMVSTWLLYFDFRSWSRTLWAITNQIGAYLNITLNMGPSIRGNKQRSTEMT